MDAELERNLEKAWNSTCRVLFGREIGPLSKYSGYLEEYLLPVAKRKSHLSGKEVIIARGDYPQSARFISEDELVPNRDYAISINDMKDIDSLSAALKEKLEYSGNRYLGNSAFVEKSDIVHDSQFVYGSSNIEQSSYICSSYMMRMGSKNVFGSGWTGNGEHLIRLVAGLNLHRCFESHFISDSSDIYFSFNCDGCHDVMFSFGQKNRSYAIGNLQLPKDKYRTLKAKLLEEVVRELEREGKYPSLFDLSPQDAPAKPPKISPHVPDVGDDMAPVEKGFAATCAIMLKKSPGKLSRMEDWLAENTVHLDEVDTPFGTHTSLPTDFGIVSKMPKKRAVKIFELFEIGKIALDEKEIGSVKSIVKALGKIAYFTAEYWTGENRNIVKTPLILHSMNTYKGFEATYSENAALTSFSLHSKFVYGCSRIVESQFSMKCYDSLYLNRCFELDSCNKCSDSYFCHNSEALQDCMFCFNMKGRRHNIGNTQLEKDAYAKAKDALVLQMAGELSKTGRLKWNIYNIGAKNG